MTQARWGMVGTMRWVQAPVDTMKCLIDTSQCHGSIIHWANLLIEPAPLSNGVHWANLLTEPALLSAGVI